MAIHVNYSIKLNSSLKILEVKLTHQINIVMVNPLLQSVKYIINLNGLNRIGNRLNHFMLTQLKLTIRIVIIYFNNNNKLPNQCCIFTKHALFLLLIMCAKGFVEYENLSC